MTKKISIWFLILATAIIVLPPAGNAAAPAANEGVSISEIFAGVLLVQPGRRNRKRGNQKPPLHAGQTTSAERP